MSNTVYTPPLTRQYVSSVLRRLSTYRESTSAPPTYHFHRLLLDAAKQYHLPLSELLDYTANVFLNVILIRDPDLNYVKAIEKEFLLTLTETPSVTRSTTPDHPLDRLMSSPTPIKPTTARKRIKKEEPALTRTTEQPQVTLNPAWCQAVFKQGARKGMQCTMPLEGRRES